MKGPLALKQRDSFEYRLSSISKHAGIFFIERVFFQILSVFTGILLARILGPTLLGRYHLGLVTVQALTVFAVMGFDQGLVRFIPIFNLTDKGKLRKLVRDNISLSFILSSCLGISLYVSSHYIATAYFHSSQMTDVLKVFSFYLPVVILFTLSTSLLRGLKRVDLQSHANNLLFPIVFIMLISLSYFLDEKLNAIILSHIISIAFSLVIVFLFIRKLYSRIFLTECVPYDIKMYLSFSFPLLLIGVMHYIIGHIDVLMLGYFVDSRGVGIYSVAIRIAAFSIFGLEAVNTILAPNISELHEIGDKTNLEMLLKVLTRWIFSLSLFVFTYISLFNAEILKLFGPFFGEGRLALVILAFGQLVNAFTGPTGTLLIMAGKQKWEVLNSIGVITLNVILNVIMIPKFGIEGAAIATCISIGTINLLKLLESYIEFGFHPYDLKYVKGVFSIIAGGLAVFIINEFMELYFILTLIFGGMLLLTACLIIYYFLGFEEEDVVIVKAMISRLKWSN